MELLEVMKYNIFIEREMNSQ